MSSINQGNSANQGEQRVTADRIYQDAQRPYNLQPAFINPGNAANQGEQRVTADRIYQDAQEQKPFAYGHLYNLQPGFKYNMLTARSIHTQYGETVAVTLDMDSQILSVILPKAYINSMFKSVKGTDYAIDMSEYKMSVSPFGKTYIVKLFHHSEL